MKIVVMSDSHGKLGNLIDIGLMHKNADAFLFLGDGWRDFDDFKAAFDDKLCISVKGNCDLGCDEVTERIFELGGKKVTLGACCKGSGMIHPNMATMLCFMTTDCKISSAMLQKALSDTVKDTFNMISVDGDTSTNDMVCIMANGYADNDEITEAAADFEIFKAALKEVSVKLSRLIAGDGEGAQRLLECTVKSAPDELTAKKIAKSIICSSLVKTAMFGSDANWGRILCAIGYTEGDFRVDTIDVYLSSCKGEIKVCENGFGIEFSEEKAKEILLEDEIALTVCMNQGEYDATAWGCDLTYDYVKINGDYRT